MSARPTLHDVARAAGVSTATVSRCLSDPARVSEGARERVARAVDALGYVPHLGARMMAASRSHLMGAIVPTLANAMFAEALQAFEDALGAEGYGLVVAASGYDPAREADLIRTLAARGCEGLLLVGQGRDAGALGFLDRSGLPAVATWAAAGPLPHVGFDNRAAMRAMVGEAVALGHRRVAVLTAPASGNDRARGRRDGARDALRAAGLAPVAEAEAPYDLDAAASAAGGLLAARPTCLACGSDVLAAGAMLAARAAGLRVPEDVSVTGFDDLALARAVTPALTTVRVPHAAMGAGAAAALTGRIGGAGPEERVLATEVVRRGSLASPR